MKAGCVTCPEARKCVLARGTSIHCCGLMGSVHVHTPCPSHPAGPSYGAGCSSVGGLPDYDRSTAAGGGAYGGLRAHGSVGLAAAVLRGGAAGVSEGSGGGVYRMAGNAVWGVGWERGATEGGRDGVKGVCSAAQCVQHTALNHTWLAPVVHGGWGMLLTPLGLVPPLE